MLFELKKNDLHKYLDEDALKLAIKYQHEIESVAFGEDIGCGYKNDIFINTACNEEHENDVFCMCRNILNTDALKDVDIDLRLAENIAHYVSGLLGGKRVYHG